MIELIVLGATGTLFFASAGARMHERRVASRRLESYARSRSLRFVPAPSSPRGAGPQAIGSKDAVVYVADYVRLGSELRTRLVTNPVHGRGPILSVAARDAFDGSVGPALSLGDSRFDAVCEMTEGTPVDADALRTVVGPLLHVVEHQRGVWLVANGRKIAISWRGSDAAPKVLDAARDVVIGLAKVLRPDVPYR